MERPSRVKIAKYRLVCELVNPTNGFRGYVMSMGCHPMGLPMFMPFFNV
jgi:hypothetical protein